MAIDAADLDRSRSATTWSSTTPRLWNPAGDQARSFTSTSCRRRSTSNYHPERWRWYRRRGERLEHASARASKRVRRPRPSTPLASSTRFAQEMSGRPSPCTQPMTIHEGSIRPQKALVGCAPRRSGPNDILLLSDVGAHKMWIARLLPLSTSRTPVSSRTVSVRWASPSPVPSPPAIVYPDRRILMAVCGDGGFPDERAGDGDGASPRTSNLGDAFVWEDRRATGSSAWKQQNAVPDATPSSAFGNPDWRAAGRSRSGGAAFAPTTPRDLQPACSSEALAAKRGRRLVVIPIDYRENQLLTQKLGEITATI